MIFTVPSELHPLWRWNRKVFADAFFHAVRDTLFQLLGLLDLAPSLDAAGVRALLAALADRPWHVRIEPPV